MTEFFDWFVVTGVLIAGIGLCLHLGESVWRGGVLAGTRARALAAVIAVAGLLGLALLYKVEAIAKVDAEVIEGMCTSRNEKLIQLMLYITTIGDVVPSFTIATILAVLVQRQGVHRFAWMLLPLVVYVQTVIQFAVTKGFDDYTIADFYPDIVLGGDGTIPSGSIARLSSIFLIAACLWHASDERRSRQLVTLGGAFLVVEAISRLYLGRHLLADIVCGLLLGLALALAATSLVRRSATNAGSSITTNNT
ncbi:phosphatase PAP2 family protein [Nocardioides speluncae]|uniref:phosphatase PAP2 family protein n=1 Tax=Nocardioides speluncae TaxID=2670337 RepID=UPI000D688815|nr:phosphatase PAP2 family protein [Nocardioides speluncae]